MEITIRIEDCYNCPFCNETPEEYVCMFSNGPEKITNSHIVHPDCPFLQGEEKCILED